MKILITGGCGFLGSNLSSDALRRGDELIILDNLARKGSDQNLAWLRSQAEINFVQDDVRNFASVAAIVQNFMPDCIFHLAGQVAMTTSIENPRMDFEINVLGSLNVLEAVRQYAPRCGVIYSSTNKVYGDLEQYEYEETPTRYRCVDKPMGFDESSPLNFHSPYGCSKGAADQYMLDYARIFGLNTIVLRHSSMYGGRQFATYDQGWIGWFCGQALAQSIQPNTAAFTISGNGKQVRDVLHAEDMLRLYSMLAQKTDSLRGQVFNVGGGIENSLSLLELFSLLERALGIKLQYEKLAPRISDQRVFVADTHKIQRALGWKPQMACAAGVHSMLDWLRQDA